MINYVQLPSSIEKYDKEKKRKIPIKRLRGHKISTRSANLLKRAINKNG